MAVTLAATQMACTRNRDDKLAKADSSSETFILQSFDLDEIRALRAHRGLFRDRRPNLYGPLLTLDGHTRAA